ncbi:Urease accessory protein ureD, putative [Anopheles sinensis]|uniref:Urease accessory protein ureD, putative n=1 Tax=Anopheles sinensis TaxID=74873 RepID=A0A084WA52_ANOSI|nr:Urease accessory protein ureD, putative [Anopheles sinensis]
MSTINTRKTLHTISKRCCCPAPYHQREGGNRLKKNTVTATISKLPIKPPTERWHVRERTVRKADERCHLPWSIANGYQKVLLAKPFTRKPYDSSCLVFAPKGR